jgi:hypothetical protein
MFQGAQARFPMRQGPRSHPFLKYTNHLVVYLATNPNESIKDRNRRDDKGKIKLVSEMVAFRRHSVDSISTLPATEPLP